MHPVGAWTFTDNGCNVWRMCLELRTNFGQWRLYNSRRPRDPAIAEYAKEYCAAFPVFLSVDKLSEALTDATNKLVNTNAIWTKFRGDLDYKALVAGYDANEASYGDLCDASVTPTPCSTDRVFGCETKPTHLDLRCRPRDLHEYFHCVTEGIINPNVCPAFEETLCAQHFEHEDDDDKPQGADLVCVDGVITSIEFASYGVPQGRCGNYQLGSCHATSSKAEVEKLCLGMPSCLVKANNNVFGKIEVVLLNIEWLIRRPLSKSSKTVEDSVHMWTRQPEATITQQPVSALSNRELAEFWRCRQI